MLQDSQVFYEYVHVWNCIKNLSFAGGNFDLFPPSDSCPASKINERRRNTESPFVPHHCRGTRRFVSGYPHYSYTNAYHCFSFGDFVTSPLKLGVLVPNKWNTFFHPSPSPFSLLSMQSLQPLYFFIESVALSMPLSAKKRFDITDFRFTIYWLRCSIVCTRMSSLAFLLLVPRINNVLGSKEDFFFFFFMENALKFQSRYVCIKLTVE